MANSDFSNPFFSKLENDFRRWAAEHPDKVYSALPDALQEGFEYFFTTRTESLPAGRPSVRRIGMFQERGMPRRAIPSIMRTFLNIMRGMSTSWKETNKYLDRLEPQPFEPQPELWSELSEWVGKKWDDVILGFTELPREKIFKGKSTLFKYAIVVGQEMKKKPIDFAPEFQAGKEVMRVYASLGLVVNDIAKWLRKRGVRCQSNHPLGGLTNTPSLAGKAGMGWIGQNGLLITREFGQRLRLAPVFVEHPYFDYTDNLDHVWIEDYCKLCMRCVKECPTQAIYDVKQVRMENVPGIRKWKTCIDRDRCFDFFWKTMGCSVCVKVCPFSKAGETYDQLRTVVEKQ
ncbi:MAG: 4Fe-4S double cluster binding domain-containing protein [Candidatus Thorarchaeota archaeon]